MIKKYIIVFGLMLSPYLAFAQDSAPWSLKACIDHAVANNIDIQKMKLDVEREKISLHSRKMSVLPSLNGSAGQGFGFGRSTDRDGTTKDRSSASTSFGISASMPLFTGTRIINEVKVQKLNVAAAFENLNRAEEDISLQVTGYYLQALFQMELQEIAQKQVMLTKAQLDEAIKLVEAGKKPASEQYDAEAQVALEEQRLVESTNNLNLAMLNLSQIINLTIPFEEFQIKSIPNQWLNPTQELPLPDKVYAYSEFARPGIKAQKLYVESSRKNIRVAKSGYFPQLNLGGGYSTNYFHNYNLEDGMMNIPFGDQLKNNASQSINLSLSVPIFNRFNTRNSVKQARIAYRSQEFTLEKQKQDLFKEIQQAYYNALAAQKKYAASMQSVEASQVAYDMEKKRYDIGKSTSLALTNAQNRLDVALSQQAQARYDWVFRYKILYFYQGEPLFFEK